MPNAIVLMTALVPTVGHKYLIDYAKNLLQHVGDQVHVIVGHELMRSAKHTATTVELLFIAFIVICRKIPASILTSGVCGATLYVSLLMLSLMITLWQASSTV